MFLDAGVEMSVDMGVATVEPGPGKALLVDMGNPHEVFESTTSMRCRPRHP